jgi:hypothetical protein
MINIRSAHRFAAAAALAFVAGALVAAAAAAAPAGRNFTIYAVSTQGQYANHADDRSRGNLDNPFNADAPVPKGKGKASRVGDNALIGFKLYSDSSYKKQIGSGSYSCTFTSAHVALCEASFQLDDGSMAASGPTNWDSTSFTLAVSGGTGKYLGARGQVSSLPVGKGHRLTFVLR